MQNANNSDVGPKNRTIESEYSLEDEKQNEINRSIRLKNTKKVSKKYLIETHHNSPAGSILEISNEEDYIEKNYEGGEGDETS
jgi:hypothetical protein